MSELLPCPFCGGAPKLHEPDRETGHAAVECVNKECVMSHMWPDIVRWNRRANVSAAGGAEAVAWRREWDGDESDLNHWIYEEERSQLDEPLSNWQPLYAHPSVAGMPDEPTEEMIIALAAITHDWYGRPSYYARVTECYKAMRAAYVRALGGA